MSLLESAFEPFVIVEKRMASDGQGGTYVEYIDGITIDAAAVLDNSMEARTAQVQGVTSLYTITTRKNVNLQYHDAIRRVSDGKTFRITSDGDDKKTPPSATLNMRQVSAEEWKPS